MAYATLSDLKIYLAITTDNDDALLTELLERATAVIEQYTGRKFTASSATRRYGYEALRDALTIMLDDDLQSTSSITSGGVDVTSACVLMPRNGPPYTAIRLIGDCWDVSDDSTPVEVTGAWGFSATPPADIVQACLRLAAYYYRQRDAQVFDVTAIPDQGIITIPKGTPADVREILSRYRRLV